MVPKANMLNRQEQLHLLRWLIDRVEDTRRNPE
jgi:hypothetical protein